MTDDMIKEHLVRAHLAEAVTLDAGTWTEVLEEVLRLRELHELYKDKTERLASTRATVQIGDYALSRYDGGYWLAHASGEGMQVRPDRLLHLMHELWQEF